MSFIHFFYFRKKKIQKNKYLKLNQMKHILLKKHTKAMKVFILKKIKIEQKGQDNNNQGLKSKLLLKNKKNCIKPCNSKCGPQTSVSLNSPESIL